MRKIGVIDMESDPFLFGRVPVPFIWGFYDGEIYKKFYSTSELIKYISNFEGIVYAHNGGKFDFHYLLEALEPDQEIMIINGRLSKFKIGKCELRDSYNIFPLPLSAYKKDDFDYTKLEKDVRENHIAEIEKYLKSDCVNLFEIVSHSIKEYGLNLTMAGCAFKYWYKNFSNLDKIPKSPKSYFKEFKPFYYGGRVECFKKGIFNYKFKSYDINSAYPYAMLHNHPFGYEYLIKSELPKDKKDIEKSFIHLKAISKGALPHRESWEAIIENLTPEEQLNKKLVKSIKDKLQGLQFPRDEFIREYRITGWEYLAGVECDALEVIEIISVYTFENTISFKPYVDYFYDKKKKAKGKNKAEYMMCKLFLNSLYGKFGQSGEKHMNYTTANAWEAEELMENGKDFCGELGSMALMSEPVPEEKQNFYNVATACSITGFVRAYMFRHIHKAKGLMYCDTDSITCLEMPCDEGEELGQWELEGEYTKGAICGKKMYSYKYAKKFVKDNAHFKNSSKGVRISEKEIFSIAKGNKIVYFNNAPSFSATKPLQISELNGKPIKNRFINRTVKMT